MKKYIFMLLLPICGQILSMDGLQAVLNAARREATAQEVTDAKLAPTLHALKDFADRSRDNYSQAIRHINIIKDTLYQKRKAAYGSMLSSTWLFGCFGVKPEDVITIEKQIQEVNDAHNAIFCAYYSKFGNDICTAGKNIATIAALMAAGAASLYLYQHKEQLKDRNFWKSLIPEIPALQMYYTKIHIPYIGKYIGK